MRRVKPAMVLVLWCPLWVWPVTAVVRLRVEGNQRHVIDNMAPSGTELYYSIRCTLHFRVLTVINCIIVAKASSRLV